MKAGRSIEQGILFVDNGPDLTQSVVWGETHLILQTSKGEALLSE